MNVDAFLSRIDSRHETAPGFEALRRLQRAFLAKVPFENLDIHIGRRIAIDAPSVYRKIVEERRGGFCYECNGAFHDLLRALGYRVHMISARMAIRGRLGPGFDHMALMVEIDRRYLVDVGNGQSCRMPLPLDAPEVVDDAEGIEYHVGRWDRGYALFYRPRGQDWAPRFLFSPDPQPREAFAAMCDWHQSAVDAPFTVAPLASLARPDGRVTLAGLELTTTRDGVREVQELATPAAAVSCLSQVFDLRLPAGATLGFPGPDGAPTTSA